MDNYIYLKEIIEFLELLPQDAIVPFGFGEPMSYRGYYDELAFEPVENARIGDMLTHAKNALGAIFTGYKGGEYTMDEGTDCWIAPYGSSGGDKIGPTLLKMWGNCAQAATAAALSYDAKTGPEFTDTGRAALLHVLWHHQGRNSPVGQPIRFALGMGRDEHLTAGQVEEAKSFGQNWHLASALPADAEKDAERYRRLRIIGAAPGGSEEIESGNVLCFQGLDAFVDADLQMHPSRGTPKKDDEPTNTRKLMPIAWGDLENRRLFTDKHEAEKYNEHCYNLTPLYAETSSHKDAERLEWIISSCPTSLRERIFCGPVDGDIREKIDAAIAKKGAA